MDAEISEAYEKLLFERASKRSKKALSHIAKKNSEQELRNIFQKSEAKKKIQKIEIVEALNAPKTEKKLMQEFSRQFLMDKMQEPELNNGIEEAFDYDVSIDFLPQEELLSNRETLVKSIDNYLILYNPFNIFNSE